MNTFSCPVDSRIQAKRSRVGRVSLRIWTTAGSTLRLGVVLEAGQAAQHQPGRETDFGDEDDQPEEQRSVPLPAVQRDDHVDGARQQRADAGQPGDDLHDVVSLSWIVTCPVSPSTRTMAPSGRSSVAPA